jgi:membrane associated rhomboid family serine protease
LAAVIPLGDDSRKPAGFPLVTITLILINILAFALELSRGKAFLIRWAVIPAQVLAGHHLSTIVTAMFLHGSWLHIISNMVFLWAFGPVVEDSMSASRYLAFYLIGGLTATVAQVATTPASTLPNLGASGAIAAVMGAFLVSYPRDRIRSLLVIVVYVTVARIPAALLIGVWFLIQFFSLGSITPHHAGGGVAYAAHVGGFLFGVLAARSFRKRERARRLAGS